MEYYNPYIRPKFKNSHSSFYNRESDAYRSEIAIVKTKETIIFRDLFYINFKKLAKDGMYLKTEELKNEYFNLKKEGYENDIILNLNPIKSYFCYIKIIKDPQNPQLEGNLMLFKFGRKIHDIIFNYYTDESDINKTLLLNVTRFNQFYNFDKTKFSNNFAEYKLDKDLNKELNFKRISITNLLRKEKINNINRSGTICH